MLKIKLSTKRQATFPKSVCEALGLEPGDEIMLVHNGEGAEESWTLRPSKGRARAWLHQLKPYAQGKDHSMESVRASIAKGRGKT